MLFAISLVAIIICLVSYKITIDLRRDRKIRSSTEDILGFVSLIVGSFALVSLITSSVLMVGERVDLNFNEREIAGHKANIALIQKEIDNPKSLVSDHYARIQLLKENRDIEVHKSRASRNRAILKIVDPVFWW